jgi:hypothetical protein
VLGSSFVFIFRFGSFFLLLMFCVLGVPSGAHADWLFGGYMGVSGTSSNTLTVTPTTGTPLSLDDVAYKGEAFRSPWYYGVRVSFVPRRPGGTFSPEIEWTHAKAIALLDPTASELSAFQQSHGLNFLLGNARVSLLRTVRGPLYASRSRRPRHLDTARRVDLP